MLLQLHGIKKISPLAGFSSFRSISQLALDEFHLFGQNIARQVRDLLRGGVYEECVLNLKPKYLKYCGEMINYAGADLPVLFEDTFVGKCS